ncbi:MAG: SagB/ThcOx family dehydrogenase [Bacteroidales bacterium]|nr:SagB/ThcOx family dehydrogenase [Bacteroidales bacterium]
MKGLLSFFVLVALSIGIRAQELKSIILDPPDKTRGLPVMQALEKRASATEFSSDKLSPRDLSDLLWAADGINRPEKKLRTAPSATNAQDIDIYVFMEEGIYLYNAGPHILDPVASGDYRKLVAERQPEMAKASVILLLTSDIARFRNFPDSVKLSWAAMDAGIVSQNIAIFCASTGLSTRPRAVMDHSKLREILKLKDSQYLMLNNPVSYPVK